MSDQEIALSDELQASSGQVGGGVRAGKSIVLSDRVDVPSFFLGLSQRISMWIEWVLMRMSDQRRLDRLLLQSSPSAKTSGGMALGVKRNRAEDGT